MTIARYKIAPAKLKAVRQLMTAEQEAKPAVKVKKHNPGFSLSSSHPPVGGLRLASKELQCYDKSYTAGLSEGSSAEDSSISDSTEGEVGKHCNGKLKHLPFPSEIRHRIYNIALQLPNCFVPEQVAMFNYADLKIRSPSRHSHQYPLCRKHPCPFDLSLLLVSKQTYMEAFHIFYQNNTLYFNDTDTLLQFLKNIGFARRQEVTNIGFDWVGAESKAAFRLLKTCSNLQTVRLTMTKTHPKGYEALREVRGLTNVIRLTKFIFNPYYGRTVEDWCYAVDEEIDEVDLDYEDDADLNTDKQVSFEHLKAGMMRPQAAAFKASLAAKKEKAVVLGAKKEVFKKAEEVEAEEMAGQWLSRFPSMW